MVALIVVTMGLNYDNHIYRLGLIKRPDDCESAKKLNTLNDLKYEFFKALDNYTADNSSGNLNALEYAEDAYMNFVEKYGTL